MYARRMNVQVNTYCRGACTNNIVSLSLSLSAPLSATHRSSLRPMQSMYILSLSLSSRSAHFRSQGARDSQPNSMLPNTSTHSYINASSYSTHAHEYTHAPCPLIHKLRRLRLDKRARTYEEEQHREEAPKVEKRRLYTTHPHTYITHPHTYIHTSVNLHNNSFHHAPLPSLSLSLLHICT